MTSRHLERAEWPSFLRQTDASELGPLLTDSAQVIVVEDGGEFIACQILQPILHAEGLWIREDHRKKGGAARQLWRAVMSAAESDFGVRWFATGCASDEVRRFLEHLGSVKLPDHYMVPVKGPR